MNLLNAIDANILLQQREQRKQKVAALRAQHEEQFQSTWAAKKVEVHVMDICCSCNCHLMINS